MSGTTKRLGDAELEIMQVLWAAEEPITSGYIQAQLKGKRNWALSTLMTTLSRLSGKGFVYCDRTTRTNMYSPLVSAADYKDTAGKSFFERLYGSSVKSMVASLYDSRTIDDNDLQELRDLIDELKGKNENG